MYEIVIYFKKILNKNNTIFYYLINFLSFHLLIANIVYIYIFNPF